MRCTSSISGWSPGEIFAFLGPNGAGKTTTIRMLMGILKPTTGRAFIGGRDCFAERIEVMRTVGYVPDDPVFYDYLRGREVIRFVGEMHGLHGGPHRGSGRAPGRPLRLGRRPRGIRGETTRGA